MNQGERVLIIKWHKSIREGQTAIVTSKGYGGNYWVKFDDGQEASVKATWIRPISNEDELRSIALSSKSSAEKIMEEMC